jgi:hypothetical protein
MMAKFKAVIALLVFFGVLILGTGLIAQQKPVDGIDPTIKDLIVARIEASKDIFETIMASPGEKSLEDLVVWSHRWMDEQIRLEPVLIKKMTAVQDHLDRIKSLETMALQHQEAGRGSHTEVLKMKYYRLEAMQMLVEIRIINPGLPLPKAADKL